MVGEVIIHFKILPDSKHCLKLRGGNLIYEARLTDKPSRCTLEMEGRRT